jgi:hypothetical protein
MTATLNYDRLKATTVNSTGMAHTVLAAEKPNAPAAVTAGSTGALDARIQVDADESGGADVQDLWKIEATPTIGADGKPKLTVVVTPILGDATAGAAATNVYDHAQSMDAFQTAAGRARQA